MENAKYCTLVLLTPYVDLTLVSVTENHVLQSALYKAMILHTFLGTAKRVRSFVIRVRIMPKERTHSVHTVQWGINKRFLEEKTTLFYTIDDKQKSHMGTPVENI